MSPRIQYSLRLSFNHLTSILTFAVLLFKNFKNNNSLFISSAVSEFSFLEYLFLLCASKTRNYPFQVPCVSIA